MIEAVLFDIDNTLILFDETRFFQTYIPRITAVYASDSSVPGELQIQWATDVDGSSGTFVVDLDQSPKTFSSFYPSNAYGIELKITFYKNDLNDITLKEVKGLYSPRPMIV